MFEMSGIGMRHSQKILQACFPQADRDGIQLIFVSFDHFSSHLDPVGFQKIAQEINSASDRLEAAFVEIEFRIQVFSQKSVYGASQKF